MKTILRRLLASGLALVGGVAFAQAYPERAVTFVVPFAAGGATDTLARQFADRMSRGKPQAILIENVAGAGGTVGAARVAKSKADGYTFLVGHVGYMAAATGLYKQLPYDPVQDFEAVARFPDTPLVLVCSKDKPHTASIQALVDFARNNPGKVNMANAGVGSSGHLVAALAASQLRIEVTHVPYKGNAPALTDILAGRVDCLFDQSNTALPQVRGGKVAALVTTARARLPQMPEVPTLHESGLPGFEVATWYGIYAPKGTPREALQWIAAQFAEAMGDKGFVDKLVEAGYVLLPPEQQRGDALAAQTRKEVALWKKVIADAGIPQQ
jgi:tripartite-type tricarboxylate transporter receptor subunit TctC